MEKQRHKKTIDSKIDMEEVKTYLYLFTLLLLEFVDNFYTLWTWYFDVHGRKQKIKVSSRLIAMDLSFHGYTKIKNTNLSITNK